VKYKTVVDVGGLLDDVAFKLAKRFLDFNGVVQDLLEIITGALKDIESMDFQSYSRLTKFCVHKQFYT
jgi:hypothetical protein